MTATPQPQTNGHHRADLYLVNTRVRAGAPAPQGVTRAADQRAQQLRSVSRAAFADGLAAGEVLGTKAGFWQGYISGGITGLFVGAALVVVPLALGYGGVLGPWLR
jgi:hypothetical protein